MESLNKTPKTQSLFSTEAVCVWLNYPGRRSQIYIIPSNSSMESIPFNGRQWATPAGNRKRQGGSLVVTSVEDCYKLVLSRHCYCHLLLASGKKPQQRPAGKWLRTEKRMDGQERTCLSRQHTWQELHVCGHALRMHKCPYKRAAHAPCCPLAHLLATLLLSSSPRSCSPPRRLAAGLRPCRDLHTCTETEPIGHRWTSWNSWWW